MTILRSLFQEGLWGPFLKSRDQPLTVPAFLNLFSLQLPYSLLAFSWHLTQASEEHRISCHLCLPLPGAHSGECTIRGAGYF